MTIIVTSGMFCTGILSARENREKTTAINKIIESHQAVSHLSPYVFSTLHLGEVRKYKMFFKTQLKNTLHF